MTEREFLLEQEALYWWMDHATRGLDRAETIRLLTGPMTRVLEQRPRAEDTAPTGENVVPFRR